VIIYTINLILIEVVKSIIIAVIKFLIILKATAEWPDNLFRWKRGSYLRI